MIVERLAWMGQKVLKAWILTIDGRAVGKQKFWYHISEAAVGKILLLPVDSGRNIIILNLISALRKLLVVGRQWEVRSLSFSKSWCRGA